MKTISIFWWTFFWSDHFLISFFVALYLTVSLRGSVLITARPTGPGWKFIFGPIWFESDFLCKNVRVNFFLPQIIFKGISFKNRRRFLFVNFFWSDHFLISFFVARYLTISLRGPVLAHYDEADRPSLMGWDGMGWDGMEWGGMEWDGWSKVSFNFFHFKIY